MAWGHQRSFKSLALFWVSWGANSQFAQKRNTGNSVETRYLGSGGNRSRWEVTGAAGEQVVHARQGRWRECVKERSSPNSYKIIGLLFHILVIIINFL